MKWHRGLPDDWTLIDEDTAPPGPDVVVQDDVDVVGERLKRGHVVRVRESSNAFVYAADDVVRDLEKAR